MAQVTLRDPEWHGYELPPVCMRCGAEATVYKRKRFSWYPPWINVLILAGLLPYAIIAAIMTKRMNVNIPLCGRHRFHWGGRVAAMVLSFFALLGLLVVLIAVTSGPGRHNDTLAAAIGFCLLGGFVAWLILLVVLTSTTMRPTEIDDRSITLTGVANDFRDAAMEYQEMLRQRSRGSRRRRGDDDDEDEVLEAEEVRPEVEEMRKRFREADSFDRPRRTARDDQIREP